MSLSKLFQITHLKLKEKFAKGFIITLLFSLLSLALLNLKVYIPIQNQYFQILLTIIGFIISLPISYGYTASIIKLYRDEKVKVLDFIKLGLSSFKKIWKALILIIFKLAPWYLISILSIFLTNLLLNYSQTIPALLFLICSIVFLVIFFINVFNYVFIKNLLFDNYDKKTIDIVKLNKPLMKKLKISYILYNFLILSIVTIVLGLIIYLIVLPFLNYIEFIIAPFFFLLMIILQTYLTFFEQSFYEEAIDLNSIKTN